MAKWITTPEFAALSTINVFGKEGYRPAEISEYFNKHVLFRKKFDISSVTKTTVKISADDYYKLYINGKFVAMGPAPSYYSHYYYNEIDVTEYLFEGENTIAVHTYYQGLINRVWVSGDNLHGLYFEMTDAEGMVLHSDESWKYTYHSGYSECGTYGYETGFLEVYDSNGEEVGFEEPEFDDSKWQFAVENTGIAHKFCSSVPVLSVYRIKPHSLTRSADRVFVDIGREICGYIEYKAKGKKGDVIIARSGEELKDDGTVRYELRCNCVFEEKHILSGRVDTLCQFDYKGFRYVELLLPDGCEIDLDSVVIIVRHWRYEQKADISFDDENLSKIMKLCADTIKYGVQELCPDCPTREKGQYLGDAGFIGMGHAYLTGNCEVLEKTLLDFCYSTFICKGMMAVSSCSLNQEIADYSLMFPHFALECYKMSGNKSFLEKVYPYILGEYEYFSAHVSDDGILSDVLEKWNLVDWPMNLRDDYDFELKNPPIKGVHNVISAYFVGFCIHLNEICEILGKSPVCDVEGLKSAFVKVFYDEKAKLFKDTPTSSHHSLHSNVLPLLFDIVTDEATRQNIIGMIKKKRLLSVNYFAYFILLTLKKEGESELLKELICDSGAWLNMLSEGATTCFEAWGKDKKWNTSLFHPWMSYPVLFADYIRENCK